MEHVFDVGQLVMTPKGEAMVVSFSASWVSTDRGAFPVEKVHARLDIEAITESLDSLEAWLDAPPDRDSSNGIRAASEVCQCPCGRSGGCHHLVHLNAAHDTVARFAHTEITGACRCQLKECPCLR